MVVAVAAPLNRVSVGGIVVPPMESSIEIRSPGLRNVRSGPVNCITSTVGGALSARIYGFPSVAMLLLLIHDHVKAFETRVKFYLRRVLNS